MGRKNRNARRINYPEYEGMDLALPIWPQAPDPGPGPRARGGAAFFLASWLATVIIGAPGLLTLFVELYKC